jgi:hypothetical protein
MVSIEDAWLRSFPQTRNGILGLVAEILADLDHHHRQAVKLLKQRAIEVPELNLRIFGLSELDFQQQHVAWQNDIDIRLTVGSPTSVRKAQPLIVVNTVGLGESPPQAA